MTTVAACRWGRVDPRVALIIGLVALSGGAWAAWSLSTRGSNVAGGSLPLLPQLWINGVHHRAWTLPVARDLGAILGWLGVRYLKYATTYEQGVHYPNPFAAGAAMGAL